MPSLKEFIDAMDTSWPVALTIFFAASALLYADHSGIRYVQGLPTWFVGAVFVAAVLSGSVVASAAVRKLFALAMRPFVTRRRRIAQVKHVEGLSGLPNNEIAILIWAAAQNTQVFLAPLNHKFLEPLVAKGYVVILPGMHTVHEWPHSIPDHIWQDLRSNPEALKKHENMGYPFRYW